MDEDVSMKCGAGESQNLYCIAFTNGSAALTVADASTAETSSNFLIRGSLRYIIRRPTCIKTLFLAYHQLHCLWDAVPAV